MTPGDFMSFITGLSMLYAPIRKLNKVNIEIQEGIAASKQDLRAAGHHARDR
ncbi:MAG: hypothetical protein MZU95_14180 [Desulfomicrobium escambiense]|nr:hypothetical protein [Desulfomicrobium escambiense]